MMELLKKQINLNTFILIDKISNNNVIDELLKNIYSNSVYFNSPTSVIAKHSNFDFLIGNKNFHQFLKLIDKQIKIIFQKNFIIEEAWSNIYNGDDYALPHFHRNATAFAGILYLTDGPGPGTYFQDFDLTINEEKGKFVLFSGHLKHEVKKFKYTKDRVTVAFNFKDPPFFDKNINFINV